MKPDMDTLPTHDDWITPDVAFLASIQKHMPKVWSQVDYIRTVASETISRISKGILFIHAVWSGPSVMAARKMNDVVHRRDTGRQLRIVVTNTETYKHNKQLIPYLIGNMGSYGEIAWGNEGCVVATKFGVAVDSIEHTVRALLANETEL